MSADEFDRLVDGVREEVHARADAGGRVRDFAAMIARAHAIAPTAVSQGEVAEASRFAAVVTLRATRTPAPSEVKKETGRSRGLIAVAAALLMAVGLAGMVRLARQEASSPSVHALPLVGPGDATPVPAASPPEVATPRVRSGVPRDMVEEAPAEPVAEPVASETNGREDMPDQAASELVAKDKSVREDMPEKSSAASELRKPRRAARADTATGEALDRAAREAWARGDLEEARALLSALVLSDAEASRIELAYGDLFVLARRSHAPQELARLWRAYLERFPRGMYAEDARAGLCRRANGEARRACWDLYLGTWPEGAHAGEAKEGL